MILGSNLINGTPPYVALFDAEMCLCEMHAQGRTHAEILQHQKAGRSQNKKRKTCMFLYDFQKVQNKVSWESGKTSRTILFYLNGEVY